MYWNFFRQNRYNFCHKCPILTIFSGGNILKINNIDPRTEYQMKITEGKIDAIAAAKYSVITNKDQTIDPQWVLQGPILQNSISGRKIFG
jgi:hypothetical protein